MIVGIDTGARRIAVCTIYEWSEPSFAWYETPLTDDAEELQDLKWWLEGAVPRRADAWLEKVVAPHGSERSFDAHSRHSMTIGVVLATVGGTLIAPASWKASILGHGHADKLDAAEWVQHCAPQAAEAIQAAASTKARRSDLYDAYCIALHGDLARRRGDRVDEPVSVQRRRRGA